MPYFSYFFQRYTATKELDRKREEKEEQARQQERAKAVQALRGDFRLPFDDFNDFSTEDDSTRAVALVDLRMGELSYALRSKPEWWKKYKKRHIRIKWEKEALEHEIQGARLTKAEVKYVLDELQGYENMRDDATGIQGIYEADGLVPEELRTRLINAVKALENVPDHKKDWHPRSNNQVLDLVHPSLYCIVYDRTLAFPTGSDAANRTSADLKKLQHPYAAAV
ncbi:hypothetical protein FRC01_013000, partial [Tulasnella sp. 417]